MDLLELYLNNYLVHPFIETLEIVFLHQQKLIFFFQLKRGGDLYSHIRQSGPFTEVAAKHIVAQLACALQQLHESGIVYGDLKPENVLFDDSGYVSLTDFGYGKMRMFRHFKKQVHTHNNMC
jgi:serum/glucocorticoid-regulated kinase 2